MPLNAKKRKELKIAAHHLKPVVRLGQKGLTDGVIQESDLSLETHELIKVHVHEGEREERTKMIEQLVEATSSELVHRIGKNFILYRKRQQKA